MRVFFLLFVIISIQVQNIQLYSQDNSLLALPDFASEEDSSTLYLNHYDFADTLNTREMWKRYDKYLGKNNIDFTQKNLADSLAVDLDFWLYAWKLDINDFICYQQRTIDMTKFEESEVLDKLFSEEPIYLSHLEVDSPDSTRYIAVMFPVPRNDDDSQLLYLFNSDESGILLSRIDSQFFPLTTSWLDKDRVVIAGSVGKIGSSFFIEIINLENGISRLYLLKDPNLQ